MQSLMQKHITTCLCKRTKIGQFAKRINKLRLAPMLERFATAQHRLVQIGENCRQGLHYIFLCTSLVNV